MPQLKKILICPLDWGIGHATRCVPIVNYLREKDNEIILAGNGRSLEFLKNEFPHLKHLELPDYKIKYPSKENMAVSMIRQIPKILKGIHLEKKAIKQYVKDHEIDVIISDNRFGCRNNKTLNIYMTHQVMIKAPNNIKWIEPLLHLLHKQYIKKFDYCWIPDFQGKPNLSGDLSHKYSGHKNTRYIGPLSRFKNSKVLEPALDKKIDVLAIISGPEPQRTIFQDIIEKKLERLQGEFVIIAGKTESDTITKKGNVLTIYDHLNSKKLHTLISRASIIICRSGYSSIMDLVTLKKKALLVPTPGQTEQEYLAQHCKANKLFEYMDQKLFSTSDLLKQNDLPEPTVLFEDNDLLDNAWKEVSKS